MKTSHSRLPFACVTFIIFTVSNRQANTCILIDSQEKLNFNSYNFELQCKI